MNYRTLFTMGWICDTYVKPLGHDIHVLDVGGGNINGTYRPVFDTWGVASYMSCDIAAGPNVDIVLSDPYVLPLGTGSMDVVISGQCFEHNEMFWLTFAEMCRVCRMDGIIAISVPSRVQYHAFPVDCWRLFPDSPRALESWSHRASPEHGVALLAAKCFLEEKDSSTTAVYRKGAPRRDVIEQIPLVKDMPHLENAIFT